MSETLIELAKRCEEASGPDRELDAAIFNEFVDADYPQVAFKEDDCRKLRSYLRDERFHDGWLVRLAGRLDDKYPHDLPKLTASLDAAVGLCERVLPDWHIEIYGVNKSWYAETVPTAQGKVGCGKAHASSPALALCAATLRALSSKGD